MALTEEQKKQALEQMKAQAKATEEKQQAAKKEDEHAELAKLKAENKALKERMDKAEKTNTELKGDNEHLKHDLQSKVDTKTQAQQEAALNDIINSSNGKYFAKQYTFETQGGKPYKFFIKMHFPTVFEQGAIEQEFADLTNGYGYQFSDELIIVFKAIAYLRVVGDECPDELKDPDKLYRTDILVQIFSDYAEWSDTFRQKQKY